MAATPPAAPNGPLVAELEEKVDLRFTVAGPIPPDRVERAIALSREKYCSVWHSLRPDIEFTTGFEVVP